MNLATAISRSKKFIIIILLLVNINVFAQLTYVPDDNFEQALIDLGYDDVLDDYVLTANISGVTDLDISNEYIGDLTGIEDFTALTYLVCNFNHIAILDVSANTALDLLKCNDNNLMSLDVRNGNNANITAFDSRYNSTLACIFVDDKDAAYLSGWSIDPNSTFVETEAECVALSVNDLSEYGISIYPNPTNGIINLDLIDNNIYHIKILDSTGRTVFEKIVTEHTNTLNISHLKSGVYIISIQTEKEIFTGKFVKE